MSYMIHTFEREELSVNVVTLFINHVTISKLLEVVLRGSKVLKMKQKIYLKILIVVVVAMLLLKIVATVFVAPWIGKRLEVKFNEKNKEYAIEIGKVRLSIFAAGIELQNVVIFPKRDSSESRSLTGEIASIKVKGISIVKYLFKKDIDIREVIVSNSNIKGRIPLPEKPEKRESPKISTLNIKIGSIHFDKIDFDIANTKTSQAYSVKEGVLDVYDLQVNKEDTLSAAILKHFNFKADQLISVSADSMYTFSASGFVCSATSDTLVLDSFSIHPNYKEYDFLARHKFQTDCIEAGFNKIVVHNFSAADFLRNKSMICSYIEIGNLDMRVFRDKRKEFRQVKIPAFQDMIYKYPGALRIDSIFLLNGNIKYNELVEKANEPGVISFKKIHAKIYKITNDTIFKTVKEYIKLHAEALLMGKGKMTVLLKGRLFDSQNTFSVNGTLSGMEAKELNPILEKNAFIYVTSGRIDAMNFSFTANNTKATGELKLLYHGFDIAVKNKRTDDTIGISARVSSLVANMIILNSNPMPGKVVRVGIIDFNRNPERFLFNYCAKSIMTGIKSSLIKNPKTGVKNVSRKNARIARRES